MTQIKEILMNEAVRKITFLVAAAAAVRLAAYLVDRAAIARIEVDIALRSEEAEHAWQEFLRVAERAWADA